MQGAGNATGGPVPCPGGRHVAKGQLLPAAGWHSRLQRRPLHTSHAAQPVPARPSMLQHRRVHHAECRRSRCSGAPYNVRCTAAYILRHESSLLLSAPHALPCCQQPRRARPPPCAGVRGHRRPGHAAAGTGAGAAAPRRHRNPGALKGGLLRTSSPPLQTHVALT